MEKKNIEEKPKSDLKARKTIGLLLENTVGRGGYQADVWSGVADMAREKGVNLICFVGGTLGDLRPTNEFENIQNTVYDLASANNVDGLIISGTLGTFITRDKFEGFIGRFKGLPIVSTVTSLPGIPAVLVDNEKGMRELLIHLIHSHGYRKIGFIRGPETNPEAEQRYQVYRDVLIEHNIAFDQNLVATGDFMVSSGTLAMDQLLHRAELEAVVAANDNMALGALKALDGWQLNVPRELAVVGFDDMSGVRDVTPPLTTVYYPAYEQGKRAAEMLLALFSGEKTVGQEILPIKLVLRESCGCPDPTVEQAQTGMMAKSETSKTDITASQEKILAEVEKQIPYFSAIGQNLTKQLLDAFYAELKGQPTESFLGILDGILHLITSLGENVSYWHAAISSMRRNILPVINEDRMLFRAENLWHQARVMIGKRSRRAEGYKRLQVEQRIRKLNELAQELDTTSELPDLMSIFTNGLKGLGIPGCYLSQYENPAASTNRCRSILAYGKGFIQLMGSEQFFPVDQLIPQGVLREDRPYNLIVEPLYHRENRLGIVVFEFDTESKEPFEGEVYETLRSQISSALWRVRINQYIQSLSEASAKVMGIQEPDAILKEAVNRACKTVGALSTQIVLVDRNRKLRRVITGGRRKKSASVSNLVGETALKAMRKREPVLIPNTNNSDKAGTSREIAEMGFGAAGCFPLSLRGKIIGAMWIYYGRPHYFPTAEVNALKLYVNQTAIAYDNAKHMKELEHLQQASEKLASVADVQHVLQQIVVSAHDVLEADSVAIWSYDDSLKTFLPDELVTQGIPSKYIEESKLDKPSPDGTAAAVIRRGYLAVIDVDRPKYKYLGTKTHGLRGAIGVKSFQGVVLKVGNEVLGVLYVNYKAVREFDKEEKSTLVAFAHQAALALKKARLLEQVRRAYYTATVVAEVSAQEDLQGTLNAIAKGTLDAFRCDAVTLNFYNPATNELGYPPIMCGVNHPERVQRWTRGEDSIVHKMLLREKPYIVDDVTQNDDFKGRRFVREEGTKSCVAIPLKVAGQKVGVMFVNYRTLHHFTGQEIDDINLFANQAAVAIRNAQLYDDATKKTKYLQALYEAGQAVTSTLTRDEILNRIVEQASLLTTHQGQQALFCNLALRENNKLTFEVSYSASQVKSSVGKGTVIDLEHDERIGIAGRVVKTGKSQLVLDVTKDLDYITGTPETKSLLAVPIILGEDVIGVIAIGHSTAGAFDQDDLNCVESLSTQAALAIQNAQLYDKATKKAQSLQALYDAGAAVTSTLSLDEILERIVEQVRRMTGRNGKPADLVQLGLIEGTKLNKKAWRLDDSHGLQPVSSSIDSSYLTVSVERTKRE